MALKAQIIPVEVDMVPLIDIISLLLMFLVIVGDMAKNANNVQMKLPRADMSVHDSGGEGRIVVQMKQHPDGRYMARVDNYDFELLAGGHNQSLLDFLEKLINRRGAKPDKDGGVPFPVKLRIPADAPMGEVERVMMAMARVKLVNVQYAAEKEDGKQ